MELQGAGIRRGYVRGGSRAAGGVLEGKIRLLQPLIEGRPPRVLISERGLFRPLFDLAKWVKTMEGRVEVSSDAVCQGNGAYLEAHAPAALLAKIYLSMVSFYFLRGVPAQDT